MLKMSYLQGRCSDSRVRLKSSSTSIGERSILRDL